MAHKLLLADDSITIQRVIELTFAGEGIEVVAVGDGADAIARLPHERPDIVLADISMPGASGYEVAAFVKNRPDLSHVPVLLLAGAFEPVDTARADAARADGVLVKPFEPQQVVARVRELLGDGRARAGARTAGRAEGPGSEPVHGAAAPPLLDEDTDVWTAGGAAARRAPPEGQRAVRLDPQPLDDYFERLGDALSSVTARRQAGSPPPDETPDEGSIPLPTLDDLLAGTEAFDGGVEAPAPDDRRPRVEGAGTGEPVRQEALADAFGQLLAVEAGEPGAMPPRLLADRQPAFSEELIDRVVARVIERLAPDAARQVVTPIVTEIAERLVREELARLRASRGWPAS